MLTSAAPRRLFGCGERLLRGARSELPERGRFGTVFELLADAGGACFRAEQRRVEFEVVAAGAVHFALPAAHGLRDRIIRRAGYVSALAPRLAGVAPRHDRLDRA